MGHHLDVSAMTFPMPRLELHRQGPTPAVFTSAPPWEDWSSHVEERARELAGLGGGWDGRDSRPPSLRTAEIALDELRRVAPPGLPMPQVLPTVDGGVQFEWHCQGWTVELEVTPAGEVLAWGEQLSTGNGWDGSLPGVREDLITTLKLLAR